MRRFIPLASSFTQPWGQALEPSILQFSKFKPTRLSINNFLEFGRMQDSEERNFKAAQFLQAEGSVRLAHMIQEMRTLPEPVISQPLINRAYHWYLESFEQLSTIPTLQEHKNPNEYCDKVTRAVKGALLRHAPTVMTMATGFHTLQTSGALVDIEDNMTAYLERFLLSRISIRFLFNQHVALHEASSERWVGSIDTKCHVARLIEDACENAMTLCQMEYGAAPHYEIEEFGDRDIEFQYIPSHLYHVMFELAKNSMRAVTERPTDGRLPPIKFLVAKGPQALSIKLSDLGGGVPYMDVPKLFSFFYSTAQTPELLKDEDFTDMNNAPLAGFGYGLPVSRLYARYFGGDLTLNSIEGYGTDACVYFRTIAGDAKEVIPTFSDEQLAASEMQRHSWEFHKNRFG
eukprot:m.261478 g.261478  ORF g.261478 m.261478 type:complete len:403 (-) comp15578_c0_seq18:487-1695(-)